MLPATENAPDFGPASWGQSGKTGSDKIENPTAFKIGSSPQQRISFQLWRREMTDRELFGEIAVRKGFCSRVAISKALCRQRCLRKKERHQLIGMILLEQGAIDNSQLISILRHIDMLRPASGPGEIQPAL
jgi:hypothetical protein